MAVSAKELGPAEIAFAEVDAVDKLEHISHIASITSAERRSAEVVTLVLVRSFVLITAENCCSSLFSVVVLTKARPRSFRLASTTGPSSCSCACIGGIGARLRLCLAPLPRVTQSCTHRALELARKYNQHIDTVLLARQRYLADFDREETKEDYLAAAAQVEVDPAAIAERVAAEQNK